MLPDDKEIYGNSKWMMFFSALFIPYTLSFTGYVKEFKAIYIDHHVSDEESLT